MKHVLALTIGMTAFFSGLTLSAAPTQKSREEIIAALMVAEEFTLYSIDPITEPIRLQSGKPPTAPEKLYYAFPILGRVEAGTKELRDTIRTAAIESLSLPVPEHGLVGRGLKCFEPRHAIRFKHGSEMVDLIICYDCLHFVYAIDSHPFQLANDLINSRGTALRDLNRILDERKVPRDIPDEAKK